ncbi:formyl transferase [bacterium]|nr:formyl transferase [bacterium]MBU1985574.1 formyl transferase [bacterium]
MRIVILTHNSDRHFYFVNRIVEETGMVVGIVTGAKRSVKKNGGLSGILKDKNLKSRLRNAALNRIFRGCNRQLQAEKAAAESEAFGGSKERFLERHRDLVLAEVGAPYPSVNDPHYVEIIRRARPDAIVIMGTCLVRKKIIESAPHVINIHTGLSPYYRGGMTNLWPIVLGEYGYFGVTIHRISLGIDSGDIIYTARPEIRPDDTYGTINSRCIQLGTDLMIQAIRRLAAGEMRAMPQWTKGKLFFDRDMNGWIACRYLRNRRRFLEEYCRRQTAGELDDVRLVNSGL